MSCDLHTLVVAIQSEGIVQRGFKIDFMLMAVTLLNIALNTSEFQ